MIWGISFSVGNVIFFDMVGKFLDFFLRDFGGCEEICYKVGVLC